MVARTCSSCKKDINVSLSRLGKNNFCSIECNNNFRRVVRSCSYCKKDINVQLNKLCENNFCSKECKYNFGRVIIKCLNCGKDSIKIKHYSNAIFCDRKCKTEYSTTKHTCKKCGNEFTRGKARKGVAEFCSMACKRTNELHGESNCETCGIKFLWSRGRKQAKPRFCSHKCRGHTGFRPGCMFRISELSQEQKLEKLKLSFEKNVIRQEGCWGWKGRVDKANYGIMTCNSNIGPTRAPRASYIIHKGPIAEGLMVCHSCDNPICTNPDHLWLGTSRDNDNDRVFKGRQAKGSKNGSSKLCEEKVKEIKQMLKDGFKNVFISEKYGVSRDTISNIKNGKSWTHVPD